MPIRRRVHRLVARFHAVRFQPGDRDTAVACIAFLVVAWGGLWLAHDHLPSFLHVRTDVFTTVLQVVPSVIVAVAVFAAGTIFVIAQLISAALGSRAVLALLTDSVARSGVILGMLLLVASLALTTLAKFNPDAKELPAALSSVVGALAIATGLYVLWTMLILVVVVWRFVDPNSYSSDLARARASSRNSKRTVEDVYDRVRALRQWLRTAAASGESRDLMFALVGLERLLLNVQRHVVGLPEQKLRQDVRSLVPEEYAIVRGLDEKGRRAVDVETDTRDPLHLPGWFGAELGRALVRGLEVGVRGLLLRRDANRILNTMTACIRLATVELGSERRRPALPDDAGYLLDRLAEAGLLDHMPDTDKAWRQWSEEVADRLAALESDLECSCHNQGSGRLRACTCAMAGLVTAAPTVDAVPQEGGSTPEFAAEFSLAARALVGWCTVQRHLGVDATDVSLDGLGDLCRAGDVALWDQAERLARVDAISPTSAPGGSASGRSQSEDLTDYVTAVRSASFTGSRSTTSEGEPPAAGPI